VAALLVAVVCVLAAGRLRRRGDSWPGGGIVMHGRVHSRPVGWLFFPALAALLYVGGLWLDGVPLRGVVDQGAGIRRPGPVASPKRSFNSPQQGAPWTATSGEIVTGPEPERVTLDPLHHDAGHDHWLLYRTELSSRRLRGNPGTLSGAAGHFGAR
jgi:hypothetical protein